MLPYFLFILSSLYNILTFTSHLNSYENKSQYIPSYNGGTLGVVLWRLIDRIILKLIESLGGPSSYLFNSNTTILDKKLFPKIPPVPELLKKGIYISYEDFVVEAKKNISYYEFIKTFFTLTIGYFVADGCIDDTLFNDRQKLYHMRLKAIALISRDQDFLIWIKRKLEYLNCTSTINEDLHDGNKRYRLRILVGNQSNKYMFRLALEELIQEGIYLDNKARMLYRYLKEDHIHINQFGLHRNIRKTIQEFSINERDPILRVLAQ